MTLIDEWKELNPDKTLYYVPDEIFIYLHSRFPLRHCCHLFFGKGKNINTAKDYISLLPLVEEDTIPEDKGLGAKEWVCVR